MKSTLTALAFAATVFAAGASQAQTESTRWIVHGGGAQTQVDVVNAGAVPARTMVEARRGNTMALSSQRGDRIGEIVTIVPGGFARFVADTNAQSYTLVISDQPVVVSGSTLRALEPLPVSPIVGQTNRMDIYEGSELGAASSPIRYTGLLYNVYAGHVRTPLSATPIDCRNAPTGHFACTRRLPSVAIMDNQTAPRPGQNLAPGN